MCLSTHSLDYILLVFNLQSYNFVACTVWGFFHAMVGYLEQGFGSKLVSIEYQNSIVLKKHSGI
jgi:hypothetical protein